MWVLKFEFDGSTVLFGKIAKQLSLQITGYPISNYKRGNVLLLNLIGTIKGKDERKKKCMHMLKQNKNIVHMEQSNGFLNILLKENTFFELFYSSYFLYLSPVLIDEKGAYHYHIGSWKREELSKLIEFVKKKYR